MITSTPFGAGPPQIYTARVRASPALAHPGLLQTNDTILCQSSCCDARQGGDVRTPGGPGAAQCGPEIPKSEAQVLAPPSAAQLYTLPRSARERTFAGTSDEGLEKNELRIGKVLFRRAKGITPTPRRVEAVW